MPRTSDRVAVVVSIRKHTVQGVMYTMTGKQSEGEVLNQFAGTYYCAPVYFVLLC